MHGSLRLLNLIFVKMLRWVTRNPLKWLLVISLATVGLLFNITHFSQAVSIGDQLDPKAISTIELNDLKSKFGAETSLGFIFVPTLNFANQELCNLQIKVNDMVLSEPLIASFFSPFKLRKAEVTESTLSYPRLLGDPCQASPSISEQMHLVGKSPWGKVLTDQENKDFAYFFKIQDLETPGAFGHFSPYTVEWLIGEIQKITNSTKYITGTAAQQYFTMQGMGQAQYLNLACILIILLCMRGLFGTWRAGFLFILTLTLANSWLIGIMSQLRWPLDPLSSCLFVMMAVASFEDFIFVSYHYLSSQSNFRASFRKKILPCFFTSLTTILGFASLAISDTESIRRFGVLAALGSALEWFLIFTVLPALASRFEYFRNWLSFKDVKIQIDKRKLLTWTPSTSLTRWSLLVFIVAGICVPYLNYSQNPNEIFPQDHIFQKSLDYIKRTRNWQGDVSLVFAPQISKELREKAVDTIFRHPMVEKVESFSQVEKFLKSDQVVSQLSQETIAFELHHSPMAERYFSDDGDERLIVYLKSTDTQAINSLRTEVSNLCPQKECWLGGEFVAFADFSQSLISTLFESLFVSILLVALVLGYLCWATRRANFWSVLISSLWGPAALILIIFLTGVSVNMITCIVASAVVGLTGDNAIQFLFSGKNLQDGINRQSGGAFQSMLLMVLCCLVFLGSYFEPPRVLGLLMVAGLLFSTLGDVFVLKGLVARQSEK